jgi:hypothetical protein
VRQEFNGVYTGERLNRVAFPMGGIGAGMLCLEGTGALTQVSLRHKPDVHHEPPLFAALWVKGAPPARVLEGPVPMWKAFGSVGSTAWNGPGNGLAGRTYGLPRFARATFRARFPFGVVTLEDATMPVRAQITGWSPFVPGQEDDSSLPVAGLEYRLVNRSGRLIQGVFSFHAAHFMKTGEDTGASVEPLDGGFILAQPPVKDRPWDEGHFAACCPSTGVRTDCAWFRGGWFDPLSMLWNTIAAGGTPARGPHPDGKPGGGGSLYLPFRLKPSAETTVRVLLAWYVPASNLRVGHDDPPGTNACAGAGCGGDESRHYVPWYAGRFRSIREVAAHWLAEYDRLREASRTFSECFYDTTLPPEVVEAVAANLAILKTPTVLRQADGRLWAWEGCHDQAGCCHGSCTHVWNYAQAVPHLFPALERTLRETEFTVSQDERGHQNFRASLPIRPPDHQFHAAADGQLGGLMKLHREWRVSGDTDWMKGLWPPARRSLDYAIAAWDPDRTGTLIEPHHNTFDIEFWGPDGMCTSFYLGALRAAVEMGRACGDDVSSYEALLARGKAAMETDLWNGAYFFQKVQWRGLRAGDPLTAPAMNRVDTPEARALVETEGPKYQYGTGCLSDGVLGDWLARCCGVEPVLDPRRVARHLASVFRRNFRPSLRDHANPQRPGFAFAQEGGLLVCSWPRGNKPALPFPYSDEVWTGYEYDVASHLMMMGRVGEGLRIVRAARKRYDGRYRNPFDEYECGHWYARAMSSYALLQGLTGARYDAVTKTLRVGAPDGRDFRGFLAWGTGFGTVGVRKGRPFVTVRHGTLAAERMELAGPRRPRGRRT